MRPGSIAQPMVVVESKLLPSYPRSCHRPRRRSRCAADSSSASSAPRTCRGAAGGRKLRRFSSARPRASKSSTYRHSRTIDRPASGSPHHRLGLGEGCATALCRPFSEERPAPDILSGQTQGKPLVFNKPVPNFRTSMSGHGYATRRSAETARKVADSAAADDRKSPREHELLKPPV